MKVKSITLENFRAFKNTKIEFSTDENKNVSIILGINGSGKTTLGQAFQWCLDKYQAPGITDGFVPNRSVFEQMETGDVKQISVDIEVLYQGLTYSFKRIRKFKKTRDEKSLRTNSDNKNRPFEYFGERFIVLQKPENGDSTPIESPDKQEILINKIFPKNLFPYIFFSGEKISELGTDISSRQPSDLFKQAVQNLLGLEAWRRARDHLRNLGNPNADSVYKLLDDELSKIAPEKYRRAFLRKDELAKEKARKQNEKLTAEAENIELRLEINKHQKTIDRYKDGQKAQEKIGQLENNKQYIQEANKEISANSRAIFRKAIGELSSRWAALSALDVLKNADLTDKDIPSVDSNTIDYLIARSKCICGTSLVPNSPPYNSLISLKSFVPPESIGRMVRTYVEGLDQHFSSFTDPESAHDAIDKNYEKMDKNMDRIDELTVQIDDAKEAMATSPNYSEMVNRAAAAKRDAERKLQNNNQKIGGISKEIEDYDDKIAIQERVMDRERGNEGRQRELQNSLSLTNLIFNHINERYNKLITEMRTDLQNEMNKIFRAINPKSVNLEVDGNYRVVTKTNDFTEIQLSTAETDSATISFIGAVLSLGRQLRNTDSSMKEIIEPIPLIMDAPLSNFDKGKINKICELLPSFSDQIIIFIKDTDGLLAREHLIGHIGSMHTIEKLDEFNSHIIQEKM